MFEHCLFFACMHVFFSIYVLPHLLPFGFLFVHGWLAPFCMALLQENCKASLQRKSSFEKMDQERLKVLSLQVLLQILQQVVSGGEPSGNGPSPLPSSGEPGPSGGEPSGNGLSPPQSPGEPGPSTGSGLSCGGSSLPADFRFGLDRAPPPGWRRSKRAWERCMFKKRRKRGGKKMRENVSF